MTRLRPLVIASALLVTLAALPADAKSKPKVLPPKQACICARVCKLPVVDNSYWIDGNGTLHELGFCPQIRDEIRYENMARCKCEETRRPEIETGYRRGP